MEEQKNKRNWFRLNRWNKFLLMLNCLIFLASVLSYLSGKWNKELFWLVYFGLAGFYLLMANVLFIVYWLLKRKIWFLISLGIVVFAWNVNRSLFQIIESKKEVPESVQSLKIMTSNVALFGNDYAYNKKAVLDLCNDEKVDVVCFQEFQSKPRGYGDINDKFFSELNFKQGYFERTIWHNNLFQSGICIFSKYPMINKNFYQFDQKRSVNSCIYVDLDLGKDTVRVFNIHLQSIRLNPQKYGYLKDLNSSNKKKADGVLEILKKLKRGVSKRAGQADLIAKDIENSPYPIILCGDFNAPPSSYAYQTIAKKLNDTFVGHGKGTGATYAGPLPFFRIDNILVSDDFEVYSHEVLIKDYSDHYPVLAKVVLK